MGIVAIAALDEPFVHAMVEGHGKLRLLLQMAAVAQLRLRLHQQEFLGLRVVRRMAGGATHLILAVQRVCGVHVLDGRSVAGEASIVDFLRRMFREDENLGLVAATGNVRSPWSMASLAALMGRAALGVERGFPVRRLLPAVVYLFVAGLAYLRPEVSGIFGWHRVLLWIGTFLACLRACDYGGRCDE